MGLTLHFPTPVVEVKSRLGRATAREKNVAKSGWDGTLWCYSHLHLESDTDRQHRQALKVFNSTAPRHFLNLSLLSLHVKIHTLSFSLSLSSELIRPAIVFLFFILQMCVKRNDSVFKRMIAHIFSYTFRFHLVHDIIIITRRRRSRSDTSTRAHIEPVPETITFTKPLGLSPNSTNL